MVSIIMRGDSCFEEPVDTMAELGDSFNGLPDPLLSGEILLHSDEKGNEFCGESCMVEGSFGYGVCPSRLFYQEHLTL